MNQANEKKTRIVVYITFICMIVEIYFGYQTNSMALLADGWHMGSHVFALGLSWLAYFLVRKLENNKAFANGTNKILTLSGYTSALLLLIAALAMVWQAIERFIKPLEISYQEATLVAIIGLIVNVASIFILHENEDHHHDHNIRAAYLHVITDAFTSVLALAALGAGYYFNFVYADSLAGLVGAIVITHWSVKLLKDTGKVLLDIK